MYRPPCRRPVPSVTTVSLLIGSPGLSLARKGERASQFSIARLSSSIGEFRTLRIAQHEASSQRVIGINTDLVDSIDPRTPLNAWQYRWLASHFGQTQQFHLEFASDRRTRR